MWWSNFKHGLLCVRLGHHNLVTEIIEKLRQIPMAGWLVNWTVPVVDYIGMEILVVACDRIRFSCRNYYKSTSNWCSMWYLRFIEKLGICCCYRNSCYILVAGSTSTWNVIPKKIFFICSFLCTAKTTLRSLLDLIKCAFCFFFFKDEHWLEWSKI